MFVKFAKTKPFFNPGATFAAIYNTWGLFYQAHPMIAYFESQKLIMFSSFAFENV